MPNFRHLKEVLCLEVGCLTHYEVRFLDCLKIYTQKSLIIFQILAPHISWFKKKNLDLFYKTSAIKLIIVWRKGAIQMQTLGQVLISAMHWDTSRLTAWIEVSVGTLGIQSVSVGTLGIQSIAMKKWKNVAGCVFRNLSLADCVFRKRSPNEIKHQPPQTWNLV